MAKYEKCQKALKRKNEHGFYIEGFIVSKVQYKITRNCPAVKFSLERCFLVMQCTIKSMFTEMNLILKIKCRNIYLKQVHYNKKKNNPTRLACYRDGPFGHTTVKIVCIALLLTKF